MTELAALTGGSGNAALAVDLAPSTTYTDAVVASFGGTFEGLGHTITGLTIASGNDYVGLFGTLSGTVRDIGLVGGTISGQTYVGGLVGDQTAGGIANAYATGAVSGLQFVGGLVGVQDAGSITNSYASGGGLGLLLLFC